MAPDQVRASHLLVKHRDARRPSSWKEAQVTRSREEAESMIAEFHRQLTSGQADFAELARKESHCSRYLHFGRADWDAPRPADRPR